MASLNKVQIIGNLGRDVELSYTPGGMAVAKFSVATTETWTDKATGQKKEKVEWHRVVAFNKQAENCGKYLHKGSSVYVEGKLQTSSYEKDGITRYQTDIIAGMIQFLGTKNQWQQPNQQHQGQQNGFSQPVQNQQYSDNQYGDFGPSGSDDIPF